MPKFTFLHRKGYKFTLFYYPMKKISIKLEDDSNQELLAATKKLTNELTSQNLTISEDKDSDLEIHVTKKHLDKNQVLLKHSGTEETICLTCKFFNFDKAHYKEGFPEERRDNVTVILRNSKNEIMCLKWHNEKQWKSFVSGGVDKGDIIQSAIDEIKEEAGYINVKFIREINSETRDMFYAPHKKVNRYLINRAVVFDLIDEERLELEEHEAKKHTPVWVKHEEVHDFLNIKNNQFIFKEYLGEVQEYDSIAVLIKHIFT